MKDNQIFEYTAARYERIIKRLIIAVIIEAALLAGSNMVKANK